MIEYHEHRFGCIEDLVLPVPAKTVKQVQNANGVFLTLFTFNSLARRRISALRSFVWPRLSVVILYDCQYVTLNKADFAFTALVRNACRMRFIDGRVDAHMARFTVVYACRRVQRD